MKFKIEFSDQRFRVVAPDGNYEDAVPYCFVSTLTHQGVVYGAYLSGEEPELDELSSHPTDTVMTTEEIKVYSFANWPALESVETEIEEIEFEEDEPASPAVAVVDVEPIA